MYELHPNGKINVGSGTEIHLGSYFHSSDFQKTNRMTGDLHSIPCNNENFPFPQTSRTVLRPPKSPIQKLPGALARGLKRP